MPKSTSSGHPLRQGIALALGVLAGIFLAHMLLPSRDIVEEQLPAAIQSPRPAAHQAPPTPSVHTSGTGAFARDSSTLQGQFQTQDAVRSASMIWMPIRVVKRLTYPIGNISMTYQIDAEEQAILGLDDQAKQNLQHITNQLLADIRHLETQHVQYPEQTDQTLLARIPAGFAPQSRWQQYQTQVEAIFGPERAALFLIEFREKLLNVTTAFAEGDRLIRVTLDGPEKANFEIQQNRSSTNFGGFGGVPDYLKHIIQISEDTPKR